MSLLWILLLACRCNRNNNCCYYGTNTRPNQNGANQGCQSQTPQNQSCQSQRPQNPGSSCQPPFQQPGCCQSQPSQNQGCQGVLEPLSSCMPCN